MATGLALMMGFVLIQNFNSPYQSESITEFWRRWHISLSTWLRDYLYVPLGGNRKGAYRTYLNLFMVMLIGGLWHGASWNFVIWGAIHGTALAAERARGKTSSYGWLPRSLRIAVTFALVCIAWVFFRAKTVPESVEYLTCLVGLGHVPDGAGLIGAGLFTPYHLVIVGLGGAIVWLAPNSWEWVRTLTITRAATAAVLFALSVFLIWTQTANPFIYFQF